jgi:hypothetical protein
VSHQDHRGAGRLAAGRSVDGQAGEPLPFGVGEIPADCAELDDLSLGELAEDDRLPVAV